jgi:hypothetical protein
MSKPEIERVERSLRTLGDTLRRAAKNADALDLKPEVKTWLLEQFGSDKPKTMQPVTDKTLKYARDVIQKQMELEQEAIPPANDKGLEIVKEIVRQQWELKQQADPTSGKGSLAEKEQQRRKSKQGGGDLPPH